MGIRGAAWWRQSRGALPRTCTWALALSVAVGGAVAWILGVGPGGVEPRLPLPIDAPPGWGAAWSSGVQSAEAATAADLRVRVGVAAAALAALAGLALLTSLLRLLGAREQIRPSLAVRWAQGAAPFVLVRERVAGVAGDIARATVWGALVGVVIAAALVLTWPVGGEGSGAPALLLALVPLVPILLVGAAAWPVVGLERRAPALLRTGAGSTDDPRAGTVRRAAATAQMGLAFALVLTGASLVDLGSVVAPGPGPAGGTDGGGTDAITATGSDSLLVPLRPLQAGVDWGRVERLLGATAPESLATAGAWTGHGARDLVMVECGPCIRGGMMVDLYGVRVTLHAVSSGFFEAAGMRMVDGRGFTAADTLGATPVAVVTRAFARRDFAEGDPLGRQILLSGPGQRWVTVVGVVDALPFRAPGAPEPDEPVLYLHLAQHSAEAVDWALPLSAVGDEDVPRTLPAEAPVEIVAPPQTVSDRRGAAVAPVRWVGAVLLISGMVAVVVALLGAAATAAAEVRGRWREAAIRAAHGASPARLMRRYLGRLLRTSGVALVAGWGVAWSLVGTAGAGEAVHVTVAWGLALALIVAVLIGGLPPARRAGSTPPAALLRGE